MQRHKERISTLLKSGCLFPKKYYYLPGNPLYYKRLYLFASKGNGSIWISNFVSFVQDHVVPIMTANIILHQSNVGIRSDQNSVTMSNISN